ncbi:MAG TPA: hypothetical protein VG650_16130 [Mycobacteriales bacterium]|nr:hypothetical protein [Mycobacteriales bacterium]
MTPAISAEDGANTRANLRTLATGEETYFTDHATYTSDSAALARSGFKRAPGTDTESLLAGVDGAKGYCLIGGVSAAGPWFLYDSKIRGGLIPQLFGQQSAAEATCSDPNVTDYQLID